MKRVILFALTGLIAAALTLQASPQQGSNSKGHGRTVEQRVAQLQQTLNLTPEQTGKVRTILQTENDKIRSLRQNNPQNSTGHSEASKEIRQVRQDSMKQIEGLLTKDQVTKLHQQQGRNRRQAN
jgi:hypothetical protein